MIWFMLPDPSVPSGGIQMQYRMVSYLNRAGIPAAIWHGKQTTRYDEPWAEVPVHRALSAHLDAGDILVMQEVGGAKWHSLAPSIPVVKIVQGHTFLIDDPDMGSSPGFPGWPNVHDVLALSEYIEDVVRLLSGPGVRVHRVPPGIDGELFSPSVKKPVIAFMPRRRSADLTGAIRLATRSGLLPGGWSLRSIDGLDQKGVAGALATSSIFLSGAEREGFGLTAAEAMSAGCYVVGFTGDGGREYLTDDVATVTHDNDMVSVARGMAAAARALDANDLELAAKIARGRHRVQNVYSMSAMSDATVAAFQAILAPDSPSVIREGTLVAHYQSHAPRAGVFWKFHRAARHSLRRAAGLFSARLP